MNNKIITQVKRQLLLPISFLIGKSMAMSFIIKNIINNLNYQAYNRGIAQANSDFNNDIHFVMHDFNTGNFYDSDEIPTLCNAVINLSLLLPLTMLYMATWDIKTIQSIASDNTRLANIIKTMQQHACGNALLIFTLLGISLSAAIVSLSYLSEQSQQLSYGAAYDITYWNNNCQTFATNCTSNATLPIYPSYTNAPTSQLTVYHFGLIEFASTLLCVMFTLCHIYFLNKAIRQNDANHSLTDYSREQSTASVFSRKQINTENSKNLSLATGIRSKS